jgi:hypothetical protein
MAKFNQPGQSLTNPTYMLPIMSLIAGIFGWILGIFSMVIGFTPPSSNYFHFTQSFFNFLVLLPGFSWLTAIITGMIGLRQIKRKQYPTGRGLAKSGIIISGIGCALLYGLILLGIWGFYLISSSY